MLRTATRNILQKLGGVAKSAFKPLHGAAMQASARVASLSGNKAEAIVQDIKETNRLAKAAVGGYRMATKKRLGLGQASYATIAGKIGFGMMKPFIGAAKVALKHPFATGIPLGMATGAARHIVNQADQRTQHLREQGMDPNNLGTDGLTLSLSRLRHR